MLLLTPNGVPIAVSEEKGERLKKQGYREPQPEKVEAPAPPAPKRRGRPKKIETENEE